MSWLDYADRDGGEFAYITHGNTIIGNSLIKQGGLSVDRYTASGSFLEFGNVSASELSLTLDNSEEWFDWEKGDTITVEIDRERQSESTPTADNYKVGTFIVDSIAKSLNTVKVVALDSMVLLDVDFDWNVQTYDITTVLRRVATLCGITFTQNISGLANYNIEVPQYQCTCRTLVSNIAEVMGTCAYFNGNNELTFGWYEASTITDFTEAVRVSSNVSENSYKVVNIAIGTSQDPRVELVKNGNEWNVTMRLLMSNPIVARHGNSLLADIIAKCYIINTSLHGMEAVTLPYPSVEPFQVFAYIDTAKSLNYLVPITNRTYSLNRNMAIKSVFNPENLTISNAFTNAGRAIVEEIGETVEETKKHFFFITDSGAHITEIANDYTRGNNILIDSDSVDIRQGTNKIATFGADTVIGSSSGDNKNVYIASDRVQLREGTTAYLQLRKDTTSPYVMVGTLADGQQNLLLRPTGIWFRTRGTNDISVIYDSTTDTPKITLGRIATGQKNVYITNSALQMREGTKVLASFGATTQIGELDGSHSIFDSDGQRFYAGNGTTQLANIGYGEGASGSGTAIAPYYDMGLRKPNTTIGNYSMAEGNNTTASGYCSHAEGRETTAEYYYSHAEGHNTTAEGTASHAEGYGTTASDYASHAEGSGTTASGMYSHAEGSGTTASGNTSHAEGSGTTASGTYSHAEGDGTTASGTSSHAQNQGTIASGQYQTALGKYNIEDTNDEYAVIIGNGLGNTYRTNALTLDWNGNVVASGNLTINGDLINNRSWDATNKMIHYSIDPNYVTNIDNRQWTAIGRFTLPEAGDYMLYITVRFAQNNTGVRLFILSNNGDDDATGSVNAMLNNYQNAVDGFFTFCHANAPYRASGQTTLYLKAYQNSGGALDLISRVSVVRLR